MDVPSISSKVQFFDHHIFGNNLGATGICLYGFTVRVGIAFVSGKVASVKYRPFNPNIHSKNIISIVEITIFNIYVC